MTDFERFFETEFPERLRSVGDEVGALSNGLPLRDASWDRKAAFLLWEALGKPAPVVHAPAKIALNQLAERIFEDLLG